MKEFFEDSDGRLSMSNLVLLGAFMVTSIIMLVLVTQEKMSEGYMTIFIGAFVANMYIKRNQDNKAYAIEQKAATATATP